ncbi:hypothetical protein ACTVZO_22390 [Streptomyces sp. IBSNAI002]|uniref:hypothetical protein n=1 Tax=Streptomyces sp. IBSNAI002 TaxID=3457500 RepID=UPI003FD46C9F
MSSHVTWSKHYSGWMFKCGCGAIGPLRSSRAKAEQDRKAHMADRHPDMDFTKPATFADLGKVFRGRRRG